MAEDRIDSVVDLAAVEAELKTLDAGLDKLLAKLKEFEGVKVSMGNAQDLNGLNEAQRKTTKGQDELADATINYDKLLRSLAARLASLVDVEAKQAEQVRQTIALVKGLTTEQVKNEKMRQKEYEDVQRQKIANNELNKSIQLRIKIRDSEEGSLEQLRLKYTKLEGIIAKLSETQRNSARGQSLVKQADDMKTRINDLQKSTGNFSANVGRYAESLGGLFDGVRREIARLKQEEQQLNDLRSSDPSSFKDRGGEEQLRRTTAAIGELVEVEKIAYNQNLTYDQSVKQVTRSYSNLAQSGNQSKEFLNEFKQGAAEAKDSAADLKDEINALSSDTRKLDLAVGTISVIASGFEAASGAAALFGANTEDVQRVTQRLVAIQNIANGVREVGEQITKRGTAANIAYNFVVQQGTILFGSGVTAANRFNAALKLSGIGLAIAGISFLASKLNIFGGESEEAKEQTEKLSKALELQAEIINRVADAYDKTGQIRREKLKQQGADEKKLFEDELSDKQQQLEELKMVEKSAFDAEIKYREERDKLREKLEKAFGKKRVANLKMSKKDAEEIQKQESLVIQRTAEARKAVYDKELEIQLFTEQQKTKVYEENVDKRKEADKKALENAKQYAENERRAALELLKFRQGLIIEEQNLRAQDGSPLGTAARVEAAKQAAEAEKTILKAQREFDLAQDKITYSQRLLIIEKYDSDVLKLESGLASRITEIYKQELDQRRQDALDAEENFKQDMAEREQKAADARAKAFEKEQQQIATFRDQDLVNNAENYKKGLKTKEEFDTRKLEIETGYQKTLLESQLRFYQKELELLQANGEDTTAALATIANIKAQLADLDIANLNKEEAINERRKELVQQLSDKYGELQDTLVNTFENVIGGIFDRQKNRIQEQIDKIDELKAKEIDRVNASADSEEKKAAKVKLIEAKAQADKEALERKQRDLDRRKAIFDRAFKGFQIISSGIESVGKIKLTLAEMTAKAASNPLLLPLIPLVAAQIPIAIATSAANLVALLATPLPKFRHGTDNAPAGLGIWGEAGQEMMVDRKGRLSLSPNKASLVQLMGGETIIPHERTKDIMNALGMEGHLGNGPMILGFDQSELIQQTEAMVNELRKMNGKPPLAIYNQREITTTAWYQTHIRD